jgi:hypothetical protein
VPLTNEDVDDLMSHVQTAALLVDDHPRPEHKQEAERAMQKYGRIAARVCGRLAWEVRARNRRRSQ